MKKLDFLPIIRPTLPSLAAVTEQVRASWDSGIVTVGPTVRAFEEAICSTTGTQHAIALSNCTSGLMLVPQALKLPAGSEVIVPSFTFAATAQALVWNGLTPVFCDCLPDTCTLDPEDVERNLSAKTAAMCPVYIYGLPPDVEALLDVGKRKGLPVYFDSAQGLGATYRRMPPLHQHPIFQRFPLRVSRALTRTLQASQEGLALPLYSHMTDEQIDAVCRCVEEALG